MPGLILAGKKYDWLVIYFIYQPFWLVSQKVNFKPCSHTSQILSDVFFSYNKGVFTLYSVYFSVTFKNIEAKKSQTNNFWVQIRPPTEFGRQLFFLLSLPLSRREHIRDLIG